MKKLIAIGTGLMLGLGVLAANPAYAKQETVKVEKKQKINDSTANTYINWATECLDSSKFLFSHIYLKRALGQSTDDFKYPTVDEIASLTEDVVDIYLGKHQTLDLSLLKLAKSVYREQKQEIATDVLQEILQENEEKIGGSFAYHVWISYNMILNKTNSIKETHKELKRVYNKYDVHGKYYFFGSIKSDKKREVKNLNLILSWVNEEIPKGDSELIKRIKSN